MPLAEIPLHISVCGDRKCRSRFRKHRRKSYPITIHKSHHLIFLSQTRLIDNISCYLPRFRDLTLLPAASPASQSRQCAAPSDIVRGHASIRGQVEAYIAPPSCMRLPYITLTSPVNDEAEVYLPARATGNSARLESGEWYYRRQL